MPSIQHTPEPAVFRSEKGAINGVASLDSNGLVPNSQLPGATQSAAGTMSAVDKTKLDGIATGATAVTIIDNLTTDDATKALSAKQGKALNDSVTTLNTQLNPLLGGESWTDFIEPTLTNGTHYNVGCKYRRFGCFVQIIISVSFSSAPSNTEIFTLPTGYRPITSVTLPVDGGGSYNAKAQCTVSDNGVVRVTSVDKWVIGGGLFVAIGYL